MIPTGKALVTNKTSGRRQKLLKKANATTDVGISSIENYFECQMFGIQAEASIKIVEDPTRSNSLHDLNISELRMLLLSLLLGRPVSSKFIKLCNAPFIERIVVLHISDCGEDSTIPRSLVTRIIPSFAVQVQCTTPVGVSNSEACSATVCSLMKSNNSSGSTNGSKKKQKQKQQSDTASSSLARTARSCVVKIDPEVGERSFFQFKLLTMPLKLATELSAELSFASASASAASVIVETGSNDTFPDATATTTAGVVAVNDASESQQLTADATLPLLVKALEKFVLTPAVMNLWGYQLSAASPSAAETAATPAALICTELSEFTESATERPSKLQKTSHHSPISCTDTAATGTTATTTINAVVASHESIGVRTGTELLMTEEASVAYLQQLCGSAVAAKSMDSCWFETLRSNRNSNSNTSSNDSRSALAIAAIDCEMCEVSTGVLQLSRISLISHDNRVILDTLVKPVRPITNYLTTYSGITAAMLQHVTVSFSQVRAALLRYCIAADTLLVGHSLDSDLKALQLVHLRCIDTALLYPHPRGFPYRLKLKKLALDFLNMSIQQQQQQQKHDGSSSGSSSCGHDSTEDARAAMQLAVMKARRGALFGVQNAEDERIALLTVPPGDWMHTYAANLMWQVKPAAQKPITAATTAIAAAEVTIPDPTVSLSVSAISESENSCNSNCSNTAAMESITSEMKFLMEQCVGGERCTVTRATDVREILHAIRRCLGTTASTSSNSTYTDGIGQNSGSDCCCNSGNVITTSNCHHQQRQVPIVDIAAATNSSATAAVSSWVDTSSLPAGAAVETIALPQREFHFFDVNYSQLLQHCCAAHSASPHDDVVKCLLNAIGPDAATEGATEVATGVETEAAVVSKISSSSGNGSGNVLLLVTAQCSTERVLRQLRAKAAACKNPMSAAAALWGADQERALRQQRKESVAFLSASVLRR